MLELLATYQIALIIFILIVAYIVRGLTGFGSGLIAIPLLSLMLPVTFVVPLIGLLDFSASISHGLKHKNDISWKDVFALLPFTALGVGVALYLIHNLDAELLKKALAIFIILYGIYSLSAHTPRHQASRFWAVPAGSLGGFIGTLFGTGGPFYVIYFQVRQLSKQSFRATVAVIFLIDGCSRIVGYSLTGVYQQETFIWLLVSLPVMGLAMFIGGRIHTSLSQDDFKRAISVLLIGAGIALFL
jgi:uncharacterized membrane protein YfcA